MRTLRYEVERVKLHFLKPAKTSRNEFYEKCHWVVKLWDEAKPGVIGIGEAAPIEFLSPDYTDDLELTLENCLEDLSFGSDLNEMDLTEYPSVHFALECALLDLKNGGKQIYFESDYLKGSPIPINGLVWMNDLEAMMMEAIQKIESGFSCIKFKIGSHDFDSECRFLERFRNLPSARQIEIRLDANGAFESDDALTKCKELARFNIHSIEQPIARDQWESLAKICRESKINIALDEELIGREVEQIGPRLLNEIKPSFIIIKPTLLGGFNESSKWIALAKKHHIGWWVTSALEGNYGLNALAQWVGTLKPEIFQGLGTGMIYENNFPSRSHISQGKLYYN